MCRHVQQLHALEEHYTQQSSVHYLDRRTALRAVLEHRPRAPIATLHSEPGCSFANGIATSHATEPAGEDIERHKGRNDIAPP